MLENLLLRIIVVYHLTKFVSFLIHSLISPNKKKKEENRELSTTGERLENEQKRKGGKERVKNEKMRKRR